MEKAKVHKHILQPITAPKISRNFHNNLRSRFVNKLKQSLGANIPKNSICLFKGI